MAHFQQRTLRPLYLTRMPFLRSRYATEGIRTTGRIVRRWQTPNEDNDPPDYHVHVVYRAEEECYAKHFLVSRDENSRNSLDLIRLPGYPRSARLNDISAQGWDPDFPISNRRVIFVVAVFWTTIWTLIPVGGVLSSIEDCPYCNALLAPVFVVAVLFEFTLGYFLARHSREQEVWRTLYEGKKINSKEGTQSTDTPPQKVSYLEIFPNEVHSFSSVLRCVLEDLCWLAGWILLPTYMLVLGGGYMCMYSFVVGRQRKNLLDEYADVRLTESVAGQVICRQTGKGCVIVQYEADGQVYKKRLKLPPSRHFGDWKIPDNPELLYLKDIPTSVCPKTRINRRQQEATRFCELGLHGIIYLIIQVGTVVLLVALFASDTASKNQTNQLLLVGGIYLACHLLLGYALARFDYQFVFRQELLYGETVTVTPGSHAVEEANEAEEGLDDYDYWNSSESVAETIVESLDSDTSYIRSFMRGKLPRLEKTFR